MRNFTILGSVTSFIIVCGFGAAQAADYAGDDYNDNIYQDGIYQDGDYQDNVYKDRTYINKSLADFERRTGQLQTDKYKKDQYDDNFSDEDRYALLNKGTKDYGLQKDFTLKNDKAENCERTEQIAVRCLHPRKIRRRLIRRGWHDFRILKDGASRIRMVARSHNGRRFKLVVSRCRGRIIKLKPLHGFGGWHRPYNYY